MLGAAMVNRIVSEVDRGDVAVEKRRLVDLDVKLADKVTKLAALSSSVRHATIFSLRTGTRHNGLAFRGPRHQGVAEEDAIAGRQAARVRESCSVCVRVGYKRR